MRIISTKLHDVIPVNCGKQKTTVYRVFSLFPNSFILSKPSVELTDREIFGGRFVTGKKLQHGALTLSNGWLPCAHMSRTEANKRSGIMASTATCHGETGRRQAVMTPFPASLNRREMKRHRAETGRA
jgi:hypothetical protein